MDLHNIKLALLGGMLSTFACAAACQALPLGPPAARAAPPTARAPDSALPKRPVHQVAGWGAPARPEKLSGSRGGTDTISNEATLGATVSRNTAINVATGNNIIDGGSFAGMSGIPMVIQNTGANVLIQNATVINLQLR